MRMGFYTPSVKKREEEQLWDIWKDDTLNVRPKGLPRKIKAPKKEFPSNSESYNPPNEYLFDDKEKKEWEDASPSER